MNADIEGARHAKEVIRNFTEEGATDLNGDGQAANQASDPIETMNRKRLQKLLDKKWIGSRLEAFWSTHNQTLETLAAKTGLTNLKKYAQGQAFPRWENLVLIAQACDSDLFQLIRFLDPGDHEEKADELYIPPEHLLAMQSALRLLRQGGEEKEFLMRTLDVLHRAFERRERRSRD